MKVTSFTIDHDRLKRGVYVSRIDNIGAEKLTTFDLRLIVPNTPPYLEIPALHTIEHLLATYLRGDDCKLNDEIIYIGPMGCRTGLYLIVKGEKKPQDVLSTLIDAFTFTADFTGIVPATTSIECGNYKEHDLVGAKEQARKYLDEVLLCITDENMVYPS